MAAQLARRRELLEAGHKPLGWKLAFGGPAAMQRLSIDAPLVGFLTDRALIASGSTLSTSGWKKPAAEPEIAVYLGKDLPGGANRKDAISAIAGLGPAIEIADVDHPSEDVEGTLARNIYQRNIILGSNDLTRAGGALEGLSASIFRNRLEIAATQELEALTGELIAIVQHTAALLAAFGESLQADQIVMAGSIIPPLWMQPGEELEFILNPIGAISVRIAP